MYTCANCTVLACANNEPEKMPKNCPMRNASVMEAARAGYDLPENHDFYVNCSAIEGLGYCQWPRLKETVEFCKRMGYHKLGLAFCKGLRKEARIVADLLRAQGFEVVSVICKTGGISKEEVGIPEEVKIHPGEFEAMCNPIAQAKLLTAQTPALVPGTGHGLVRFACKNLLALLHCFSGNVLTGQILPVLSLWSLHLWHCSRLPVQ